RITLADIDYRIGSRWIPLSIYGKFAQETFMGKAYELSDQEVATVLEVSPIDGVITYQSKFAYTYSNVTDRSLGVPASRYDSGRKIFENLLNSNQPTITKHVETCVLLSHKSADDFISVKMEYADDRKIQPDRITYRLIQEYIEEKYGFKVHTANIAEVKRNLGLPMYDAPNAVEELKRPYKPAPEYKVEAIKDALRHFKVID
ncbi:TPA: hypothetical protein ACJOAH_002144, partial [Streptococcus agalactiae]